MSEVSNDDPQMRNPWKAKREAEGYNAPSVPLTAFPSSPGTSSSSLRQCRFAVKGRILVPESLHKLPRPQSPRSESWELM